ncbi:hypothetical protein ACPWSR_14200 [Alloiococcus sp. CFN-8]|uniref:hypothetical protein n=1 Tax=Alloiococcus sp. CFN-8 TaxID=3416081 RepID=UPI003CF1DC00
METINQFLSRIKEIYGAGMPKGVQRFTCIKDMAILCGMVATSAEIGAIGIGNISPKNYLVTLGGTEITNKTEALGVVEDLRSAFGLSNEYLMKSLKAITENIPKRSTIFMYGYSLGGMVMQQVMADKNIKNNYTIKAVAIGSPITAINRQRITIIEDTSDIVPKLSFISVFLKKLLGSYDTHIIRNGGYKTTIGAHALSYVDSPVWDDVDVFGKVGGQGFVEIDMNNFVNYYA